MSIKPAMIVLGCVAFMFLTDQSIAQRGPIRLNQDFRYLGAFQSAGYHWRTPGPCVGYYNPYSAHNSALRIGGYPQGAGDYISRMGYPASPVYEHPSVMDSIPAPGGISVQSVVDGKDEVSSELTDEELKDLEKEVQSILDENEAQESETIPNQDEGTRVENVDETSLWSGVNAYGKKVNEIRHPSNRRRRATRKTPLFRTW